MSSVGRASVVSREPQGEHVMRRMPPLSRRRLLRAVAATAAAALVRPPVASAQPALGSHQADPLDRRGAARGRARQLDHLQCRRRPGRARRLRAGDGRLLRRRRAPDRFVADVRLVPEGDRTTGSAGSSGRRACSRPTRSGSRRAPAARTRSKPRADPGACRASTCCRSTICSPGRSICGRSSP